MKERDIAALNGLFNTALSANLPYRTHQITHEQAAHLDARLKKLHELEQAAKPAEKEPKPKA